jgi:hypothetical protein
MPLTGLKYTMIWVGNQNIILMNGLLKMLIGTRKMSGGGNL